MMNQNNNYAHYIICEYNIYYSNKYEELNLDARKYIVIICMQFFFLYRLELLGLFLFYIIKVGGVGLKGLTLDYFTFSLILMGCL